MPAFSLDVIHLSLAREPSPDAMELPVEVCRVRDSMYTHTHTHSVLQQRGDVYAVMHSVVTLSD